MRLLEEAGFADALRRGFRDSDIEGIDVVEQREESLFVEGRRP